MLPGFPDVSEALVADTVVLVKDRHIGEWSRTESPEIAPHIYTQLVFNKDIMIT